MLLFEKNNRWDSVPDSKSINPWEIGETVNELPQGTGNEELDKIIEVAGYSYDPAQDIFYSTMNPWQREMGYCRIYDQAAAPLGMIIDCEPIYFEYDKKKWLIGIWKGQYDMVSGGEIGVYKGLYNLNIPGNLIFYEAIDDTELLDMAFTLRKNGEVLLTREGCHWWLTGFKLADFAEPSELTMEVRITLSNPIMRDAFVTGLLHAGYNENEIIIRNNTIYFTFDKPRTPQPFTRTAFTDELIQKKNKFLCDKFQELTAPYDNVPDKIKAIEEMAPDLYQKFIRIGKTIPSLKVWTVTLIIGIIVLFICSRSSQSRLRFSSN